MKILYLAELNPFVCNGGGEYILKGILNKGNSLGHSISIFTPNDNEGNIINEIAASDLVICADMDNEPMKNPRTWFSVNVFNALLEKKNYITFATGYCDACRQDYTPCNLSGKMNCPNCPKNDKLRKIFYASALNNYFLSPLQAEYTLKHLDCDLNKARICIPEIDTTIFYNYGKPRDIDYIICGVICPAKGYFKICEYIEEYGLQNKNIVFVGQTLVGKPKYGNWIQKVDHKDMAKLMNRSKVGINLPQWKEAFSLVSIEQSLCGCELITNKNLGSASCFNYNLEELKNPDNFKGNYEKFWKELRNNNVP